ncbi:MAG: hypothetical protein IPK82_36925 [Polyangiaceae bacterium]|nr:hypothetical protein [Polyangiaceae bacterium]
MKTLVAFLSVVVVSFFAGCDGESTSTGGTGGSTQSTGASGGSGGTAGTGATVTTSGGSTGCPTVEPQVGDACDSDELRCSYGESVIPSCRRGYKCLSNQWQPDGLGCTEDPAACPSPTDGVECATQQALCIAGDNFCVCAPCGGAGCPPPPFFWSCGTAPQAGCPAVVPNDGTACDTANLECFYGVMCAESASIKCVEGAWKWDPPIACP